MDDNIGDETSAAETAPEDAASNEVEPITEISNSSPPKRGRGRPPQGSKKLKVCVTDVNLTELGSEISNGESRPTPKRGRGRPRLSDVKDQDGAVKTHKRPGRPKGSENKTSETETSVTNSTPKKRGRPKKSLSSKAGEALPNGESDKPKPRRGRPKGSGKRKSEGENDGSSGPRGKVGTPKGSPNKKPRLLDYDAEIGGKGLRRKSKVNYSEARKKQVVEKSTRGRGRPKGSLNKKKHGKVGRPRKVQLLPIAAKTKRTGRKKPLGRPRKHPLPSPEELNKPRVWKPLGRPRKYPRVDPPEGTTPAPTRSPGRPRKSDSKKGAHLRKTLFHDGTPKKRGRPPGSGKNSETSRKRGRPKGSVNKNKELNGTEPASELPASDVSPVTEEVEEVEQNVVMMPIEVEAEEMLAEQDVSLEVENQA